MNRKNEGDPRHEEVYRMSVVVTCVDRCGRDRRGQASFWRAVQPFANYRIQRGGWAQTSLAPRLRAGTVQHIHVQSLANADYNTLYYYISLLLFVCFYLLPYLCLSTAFLAMFPFGSHRWTVSRPEIKVRRRRPRIRSKLCGRNLASLITSIGDISVN